MKFVAAIKSLALRHTLLLLFLLFIFTRLTHLTLLPIFSDEANYLDWGWRGIVKGNLFHSLYDGKQPFLMWFFGLGQIVFPDPLWGARFVSVLTGTASFFAIYKIWLSLFDKKTTYYSQLLFTFVPFFIFFDRQALMESSLVSVGLWTFYLLLRLIHQPKLSTSLVIGALLGMGFFIKTSAAIFLVSYLLILLLHRSFKLLTYSLFSLSVFVLVNLPLFVQTLFWATLDLNRRYSLSPREILMFPVQLWSTNLFINLQVLLLNFTPLVFLFGIFGLYQAVKSKKPDHLLLALWLFIPLTLFSLSARTAGYLSFRYLTPFIPLFVFPVAYFLSHRSALTVLITLAVPVLSALVLIFSPPDYFYLKSRLTPYSYIYDYVNGFDTGYQVNALLTKLYSLTGSHPAYIAMAVHAFNPEAALLTYFRKSPTATPIFLDAKLLSPDFISQTDCLFTDRPLYFVAKLNDTAGLDKFFTQVAVVTNPKNQDYSTIYTFKTGCSPDRTVGIRPLDD